MAPCDAKKEIDRLNRENAALISLVVAIEHLLGDIPIDQKASVLERRIRHEIHKASFLSPEPSNE